MRFCGARDWRDRGDPSPPRRMTQTEEKLSKMTEMPSALSPVGLCGLSAWGNGGRAAWPQRRVSETGEFAQQINRVEGPRAMRAHVLSRRPTPPLTQQSRWRGDSPPFRRGIPSFSYQQLCFRIYFYYYYYYFYSSVLWFLGAWYCLRRELNGG